MMAVRGEEASGYGYGPKAGGVTHEVRAIVGRDSLDREGRIIIRKVLEKFLRTSPPTDD